MKKSRGLLIVGVAVLALLAVSVLAACGSSGAQASSTPSSSPDVATALKGDDQLSQFAQAVDAAGLAAALAGKGPYTVFVRPTRRSQAPASPWKPTR